MSTETPGGKQRPKALDEELAESYGRYAQAIILDRAIPDARDGLKPVQRRILYAMNEAGNTFDKPYRKSAKTVGDVMGNYHPHGDQSIYDALVRLAQPWKMRYPLIDGQGNFGSVDDDPPAAMRYTEARTSDVASELVRDIEKETVDWRPNFDDKSLEPVVLPGRFPSLLCNGTSGVSTGFATEIPPHNLTEVIEAAALVLHSADTTLEQVMAHIKGPDFPTGGIVTELDGLLDAYTHGRGRVLVQSRWTVETLKDGKSLVVVTELPFGVIKGKLVSDLEDLRVDKAVQGLLDVRDESDREGQRIVLELAKSANVEGILAVLLKKTDLQVYYHFNMVAIHRGRPMEMGLLDLLRAWVDHQCQVVRRRSEFDLRKSQERLHIVDGLVRAVDILDEIIATIRKSSDRADACANLIAQFSFSEAQANAILDLRLHRLTNLQILELQTERDELRALIAKLTLILSDDKELRRAVESEMRAMARKFGDARRTEIRAEVERYTATVEVTVKSQDVVVTVSREGYVRRSSVLSLRATGESLLVAGARDGDAPIWVARTNTTHKVLLFSRSGTCFALPVHQVPEDKWAGVGTALVNVVPIDKADRIVGLVSADANDFRASESCILFVTEQGMVKRTELGEFDASRSTGIVAIGLQARDAVVAALRVQGDAELVLVTANGSAIRFRQADVSVQGRSAKGVRGIGLEDGDRVVAAFEVGAFEHTDDASSIAIFTEQGRSKRSKTRDLPRQLRAGKGMRIAKVAKKGTLGICAALRIDSDNQRIIAVSQAGERIAVSAADIQGTVREGSTFPLVTSNAPLAAAIFDLSPAEPPKPAPEEPPRDAEPEGGDGAGQLELL
jgi:topoisomerase-4 subunit A